MAIENAKKFVDTVKKDEKLTALLHSFTASELLNVLEKQIDTDELDQVAGGCEICVGGRYC